MEATRSTPARDRTLAGILFLGCLLVYHLNGKPQFEVDCITPPYTAWALLRWGDLDLRPFPDMARFVGSEVVVRPDGSWISYRSPGTALAAAPFVAPLAWTRSAPPGSLAMMHLGKLAAAVYVSLSVVIFFFLVRRLAPESSRIAWAATALYAFGTSVWSVASQGIWAHGPAVFCVCLGLSLLLPASGQALRWKPAALAGLVLGLAVLARPPLIFFAAGSGLALLLAHRWRPLLAFTGAAAVPIIALFVYQIGNFGDPLSGGYGSRSWNDRSPLWYSTAGLLISPSRGLLVYTPALLFALPGLLLVRRMESWAVRLLGCWLVAFAATLACYARWPCWWGGWCYGPRFFIETMPLLCLLVALGLHQCRLRWQRALASGLVGLSVLVHALGVFGHSAHFPWHMRHEHCRQGQDMFALRDSLIEAHARDVAAKLPHPFRSFGLWR